LQNKINEILDKFAKTFKKIDLTLDRLSLFLAEIGNPQNSMPPVIHIAGSNGKGSTLAFLRAMLEAAGKTCHVYTSPHLIKFNERVVIAGKEINDTDLLTLLQEIDKASEGKDLTYFEKTTVLAFLAFSRNPADYVLLETGLGGRLDATNLAGNKTLSIITPISLEHQEYLGDTLGEIATEKAGIIPEKGRLILAPQAEDAEFAIKQTAKKQGAKIINVQIPEKFPPLALKGEFQKINAATAMAAAQELMIDSVSVNQGLASAKWLARLQQITSGKFAGLLPDYFELWLDSCHNAGGAEVIAASFSPDYMIIGMLNTKDASEFIAKFRGKTREIWAIPIPDEENCHAPEKLVEIARKHGIPAFMSNNLENAITNIVIKEHKAVKILICGSIYLAGKILEENNV